MQQECGGEPCPQIDCTAELGRHICRLYADFDSPYPFQLLSVGFAEITTTDPDGFYQHPLGTDTSPLCVLLPSNPDLQCDSFVTIGETCAPNGTTLDRSWNGCAFNCDIGGEDCEENVLCGQALGSWYNNNFFNGQGDPLPGPDPDVFRVLIAQFAISPGENVSGSAELFWHEHTGYPQTQSTMGDFSCLPPLPPCPAADFDGSGDVGAADLAQLLGSWGPCAGCPADFDNDGDVDAADLAQLLGSWGPCQ